MTEFKVDYLLSIIAQMDEAQGLLNFYENAQKKLEDEKVREVLTEAAKNRLWEIAPKKAKAYFGDTVPEAKKFLEEVIAEVWNQEMFQYNTLLSRVKSGGLVMTGEKVVNQYISYKPSPGYASAIMSWDQDVGGSEPYLVVELRVFKRSAIQPYRDVFEISESAAAIDLFKKHVNLVCSLHN